MSELAAAVRERDRTAYLATLFAPEPARPWLVALAAYAGELDRIVDRAHEPAAAELRLKWWGEAIAGRGFGEGASLPLVRALQDGAERCAWPIPTLAAMAEARAVLLYADPFPDWDEFDGLAGETEGAVVQLSAMALAVAAGGERQDALARARSAATAAGHAGVLALAAGAAEREAAHLATGRTRFPESAWRVLGCDWRAVTEEGGSAPVAEAVAAFAAHGREALGELEALLPGLDPALRPAFVRPLALARWLGRVGRTPSRALRQSGPARRTIDVWLAARHLRRAKR